MSFESWKSYDPSWLITEAQKISGEYPWLVDALKQCTKAKEESDLYTHFVDASNPNDPGSEWQFQESIILDDTPAGEIVIDIVKPNRVGGIEFLSRVMGNNGT